MTINVKPTTDPWVHCVRFAVTSCTDKFCCIICLFKLTHNCYFETEKVQCLWIHMSAKHKLLVLAILTICEDWSLIIYECLKLFLLLEHLSLIIFITNLTYCLPLFTSLDTHNFVGICDSGNLWINLQVHFMFFSYERFHCQHLLFSSKHHCKHKKLRQR